MYAKTSMQGWSQTDIQGLAETTFYSAFMATIYTIMFEPFKIIECLKIFIAFWKMFFVILKPQHKKC